MNPRRRRHARLRRKRARLHAEIDTLIITAMRFIRIEGDEALIEVDVCAPLRSYIKTVVYLEPKGEP